MRELNESYLFIRALAAHVDRLQELLGDDWPDFQARLRRLLATLGQTTEQDRLLLIIDEMLEIGLNSPAAGLVCALFNQASEQAGNLDGMTMVRMFDPTSQTSREVGVEPAAAAKGIGPVVAPRDIKAAGQTLVQALQIDQEVLAQAVSAEDDMPQPATADESAPSPSPTPKKVVKKTAKKTIKKSAKKAAKPLAPPTPQKVQTYPNLQGDDYAYVQRPYLLTVKLSDQPQPVPGDHISVPKLDVPVEPGEVVKKLQVKLLAPDFELAPAEAAQGWQRDLNFYVEAAASNALTFTLLARDRFAERYFAGLKVQFLAQGQVLGEAARQVEVLPDNIIVPTPLNAFPQAPGYPLDERGNARLKPLPTPLTYRVDDPLIHLTVTIAESQHRDQLVWDIASPYLTPADFPPGPYFSRNLGAEEFVKEYLAPFGMPGNWPEDHMDLEGHLKHLSIRILFRNLLELRHSAPPQFWSLYQLALQRHLERRHKSQSFTILFRTADTHIPWELMPVSEQVESDKMPLLLGSAHQVGRWLLEVGAAVPEPALDLAGFTLAAPTYADNPLPEAQAEREFIQGRYAPAILEDSAAGFISFMETGAPTNGTGILHFAGHGDCCTDPMRRNWLVLTNKEALYDINTASTDLGNRLGKLRPTLAFFNACNVGRAAPGPLGSNGGWGRALLYQQYKGYIGPLWSVYDKHARDISQTFYTLALDQHLPLGEVMRQIRAKFSADNRLFTYLAYLYLGHPLAQITYTPFAGGN